MPRLRRATRADVGAVTALVREAYAPWVSVMGREPMPMRFDYAKAVDETIIELHELDGVPAALIQMRPEVDHLMLINVAVAPPHQGRGLGRALLTRAETFALDCDLAEIRLFTNKLMQSNLLLYARLGYMVDREEPFAGGTVVHMSKRLRDV